MWREAYAEVMPAPFLAGLDERRSVERWREMLVRPSPTVLVAAVDGVVIGFAVSGPTRDDPAEPASELHAINVLAAHHGSGLSQTLLDAALAQLPASDAVSLWVVDSNARARAFYARNGFEPDGRTATHGPTGVAEVRLVRPGR